MEDRAALAWEVWEGGLGRLGGSWGGRQTDTQTDRPPAPARWGCECGSYKVKTDGDRTTHLLFQSLSQILKSALRGHKLLELVNQSFGLEGIRSVC